MKKLNNAEITAKCVEISKCLIDRVGGLVNYDLGTTQTIGDAARLAVSIRNKPDTITQEMLAGISTALKMDFRVVESKILPIFETLNWVETKKTGNRVESLNEAIPPSEDILSSLGKIWHEQQPTAIDEASIESLSMVSKRPFSKDALISDLSLQIETFETVFDYGDQARYLGKFVSEEHQVDTIWSPLYWAHNAEKVVDFFKKQSEPQLSRIGSLIGAFNKFPGIPDDKIDPDTKNLVDEGISHGIFPAVAITDRQGNSHEYVFAAAPEFELNSKADLFEKARMIVSCIRHGQYHAEVTKILYPRSILNAMRTNTMKPHPYANIQYAILKLHNVIEFVEAPTKYGKAFKVIWVDTPENNIAADIANVLLSGENVISAGKEELDAKEIIVKGLFNYSSEQRRLKTAKNIAAKNEFDRLLELTCGVRL